MAETKLITQKIKHEKKPLQLVSGICRSVLHQLLQHLEVGQITFVEQGKRVTFGKDEEIKAEVIVNDPAFYTSILTAGSIGSGESYIEGWWDSPDVTAVIELFAANLSLLDRLEQKLAFLSFPFSAISRWWNKNTRRKARENIMAHYDLGNELYTRFLDPTMLYSSAIYPSEKASLHDASLNKMKVICDSLELTADDHLLEIGTGWGGLALYAAKHYGCQVTTTTISEQQYQYAKELFEQEGVADRINLLKEDYRDLTGEYSKLVSIEMIEAVGHQHFREYFEQCDRLLAPGGRMLIQSILIADERYESYRKGEDFIQRYIFPGGALPSKQVINEHINKFTSLSPVGYFAFGFDYARTLADWRENFNRNWETIKEHGYDEKFKRLWNFYFHYCEGGFWQDRIDVAHFVFKKQSG